MKYDWCVIMANTRGEHIAANCAQVEYVEAQTRDLARRIAGGRWKHSCGFTFVSIELVDVRDLDDECLALYRNRRRVNKYSRQAATNYCATLYGVFLAEAVARQETKNEKEAARWATTK
jgi:hypothetical protein